MLLLNVLVIIDFLKIVNEAIEKYRLWLTDKYKTYLSKVVDLIASKDAVCQVWYWLVFSY